MNKKGYSYVFWDWNGTLIDDLETNFSVINTLLSRRKRTLSRYPSIDRLLHFQ